MDPAVATTLTDILNLDIYRFFLGFARIGSAMMVLPALGTQLMPSRARLLMALSITFVVMPVLAPQLPPLPRTVGRMVLLLASEIAVGFYLGMVAQVLISALSVAGTFMGYQIGLTNAFSFDTVSQQQGMLVTGFLSNVGLMAIFATDTHHVMLRALVDSYTIFVAGQPLPFDDLAETLAHLLTDSFRIGLQLSAPLIVFGLVFYAALGLISRLVPQMQVFFIGMPVQVLVGMWLLMVSLPAVMLTFLRYFSDGLMPYLTPR